MFQLVMTNLQSILENVDTPELLCHSVKCILQVAHCYPHVFSINFRVSLLSIDHLESSIFFSYILFYIVYVGYVVCLLSSQDTVDILVGWHIDHTQKQSVTQQVSGHLHFHFIY